MNPNDPNQEEFNKVRRDSITQTIRLIGMEELEEFGQRLIPDDSDPWSENYARFIRENSGQEIYHAMTSDHVEILYCPVKNVGVWSYKKMGRGRISPENLALLKDIVDGL